MRQTKIVATSPDKKWLADFIDVTTRNGWLYRAQACMAVVQYQFR